MLGLLDHLTVLLLREIRTDLGGHVTVYVLLRLAVENQFLQLRELLLRSRVLLIKVLHKRDIDDEDDAEEGEFDIIRSKSVVLKPEMPEEAILQMEMLGHRFYLFLNGENEKICVVYKRKDGGYGLIEPEI